MGRELMRVPLDFDLPMGDIYPGRLPPEGTDCGTCQGEGWLAPDYDVECSVCEGTGHSPPWRASDPPKGEGYQIWETVSEGSPVSPVFATPEALARWMVEPGNDNSITRGRTYEQWLHFITGPGWAPSMVMFGGRLMDGIEAASVVPPKVS